MRLSFIIAFVILSNQRAFAFTLEPSAAMTTINRYQVENIDAQYDLSGAIYGLESLFDFGDSSFDEDQYFWGVGFSYGSFRGDLEDVSMASGTLPQTGQFNTYIPQIILGFSLSDIVFKIKASPFVQISEEEGVTQGDQKYGFGGGAELGYKVFEYMSLNVGYHYYAFAKGKNSTTGLSGSLANPVNLQFLTVGISFPFHFGSMESSSRGSSSRRPFRRSGQ